MREISVAEQRYEAVLAAIADGGTAGPWSCGRWTWSATCCWPTAPSARCWPGWTTAPRRAGLCAVRGGASGHRSVHVAEV